MLDPEHIETENQIMHVSTTFLGCLRQAVKSKLPPTPPWIVRPLSHVLRAVHQDSNSRHPEVHLYHFSDMDVEKNELSLLG